MTLHELREAIETYPDRLHAALTSLAACQEYAEEMRWRVDDLLAAADAHAPVPDSAAAHELLAARMQFTASLHNVAAAQRDVERLRASLPVYQLLVRLHTSGLFL